MKLSEKMKSCKVGADKFLKQLEKYTDDAIVSGGFARDYILRTKYNYDIEANDVDIYVRSNSELKRWLKDLDDRGICCEMTSNYEGLNNLDKVYKFESVFPVEEGDNLFTAQYPVEVQLILVNTDLSMEDYVTKHFDLSICMATYDGKEFKELPEFTDSVNKKVITFNENLGAEEAAYGFKKHVAKITCRFARLGFVYEGYNPKFNGYRHNCEIIRRTKLADKFIEKDQWLYKTDKFYYAERR